jgi:class 3 adenylate cyclase
LILNIQPNNHLKLIDEYFYYLQQSSKLYGGIIHRFTGDSILVIFDSRQFQDKHSFNAICCAQLFMHIMMQINQQHKTKSSQSLEFRLSVHSGDIFVSISNSTKNSNQEMTETAIGKTIETCEILCEACIPGELIISETTYSHAGGEARLLCRTSTEITMPRDNMSFVAYLLGKAAASSYASLIEQQVKHILPTGIDNNVPVVDPEN